VRILIVQRSLSPPGGGNAVAAWMVHALAREHEVATLTARPWSPPATNAFYGTSIPDRGVTQHVLPAPWSWLDHLDDDRAVRLRMCTLLRHAKPLTRAYDLLITTDNFGAFAKPGMQYVHFPAAITPRPARLAPIVSLYFAFCDALMGLPWSAAAHNLTLANSQWTAAGLRRDHGIAAHVLYPPVVDPGEGLPWEQRSDTFLCISRFTESKRIEMAMSIVRRLRAHTLPRARLIIVGSPVNREYTSRLRSQAARAGDWIEFCEDPSRERTNRLIGSCRYALQAMVGEHFGMATAELAKGGCLVLAHESGGTPEVLAEPALLWKTEDDAVQRVGALTRDAATREAIRWRLRRHAQAFTTDRFCSELRQLAERWVVQ
jgi:glycosyltransferase involved in cell wall biosynthesis